MGNATPVDDSVEVLPVILKGR